MKKKKQEPWEESPAWNTEAKFWQWMRGNLRRALWQHYPVRTTFKKENTWPATEVDKKKYKLNKNVKRIGICGLTGNIFPASQLEVDHVDNVGSLRSWQDVPIFIERLLCSKENMMLVSKEAHKIKSYQERMGITFEEAKIRKEIIAFKKLTLPQMKDKMWTKYNIDSSGLTSKTEAAKMFEQAIRKERE